MNDDANYPVCHEKTWRKLGVREYKKVDMASLAEYVKKRYRVLFDVWFPGKQEVALTSSVCESCGFVTNLPRVSVEDVDAKYRYLETLGQDYGESEPESVELLRSKRMFSFLSRHLKPNAEILDFGGCDGRLCGCLQNLHTAAT
jgi:hypothetical protein